MKVVRLDNNSHQAQSCDKKDENIEKKEVKPIAIIASTKNGEDDMENKEMAGITREDSSKNVRPFDPKRIKRIVLRVPTEKTEPVEQFDKNEEGVVLGAPLELVTQKAKPSILPNIDKVGNALVEEDERNAKLSEPPERVTRKAKPSTFPNIRKVGRVKNQKKPKKQKPDMRAVEGEVEKMIAEWPDRHVTGEGTQEVPQLWITIPDFQDKKQSQMDEGGAAFRKYGYTKMWMRGTPDGEAVKGCLDGGSPLSCISRQCLERLYPAAAIRQMKGKGVKIKGVGNGQDSTSEYVVIPIFLRTIKGGWVWIVGEVHVVNSLACGMLLGNNLIRANRLETRFASAKTLGKDVVKLQGEKVEIEVLDKPTAVDSETPKYTNMTLADHVILEPGMGRVALCNPKVEVNKVDAVFESCELYPNECGWVGALDAVMNLEQPSVPIWNLSRQPKKIPKGTTIGRIRPWSKTDSSVGVMMIRHEELNTDKKETEKSNRYPPSTGETSLWKDADEFSCVAAWIEAFAVTVMPNPNDEPIKPDNPLDDWTTEQAALKKKFGLVDEDNGVPLYDENEEEEELGAPYSKGLPFVVGADVEGDGDVNVVGIHEDWGNKEDGSEWKLVFKEILIRNKELFRKGVGKFNDGVTMPIPFINGDTDVDGLKQRAYTMSKRDMEAADGILDPLKKVGIVENVPLGEPSAVASPAFVVWHKGKPRVVVDMRKLNLKLYPDAYPLPKQDDILGAMGGSTVFSSLDITKGFFQQPLALGDRWKAAFITPHRGHERLTVATMGLANSPGFFQHRMEDLLKPYLWKFALVYIDDVIIYSRSLDEHVEHLGKVLKTLRDSGITLAPAKCHIAFPSVDSLGHHVSRLGLSTAAEKVAAVKELAFPSTLKKLETALGFFGYYRKFVPYYSHISGPLLALKTAKFKGAPSSGIKRQTHALATTLTPTAEEMQAWNALKSALIDAPTLAFPDFSRDFILYCDGSKERGYGTALHQLDHKGIERPVLFISKQLNAHELRYWPTELELGCLVWSIDKLQHYLDGARKMIVYTDHWALQWVLHLKTDGTTKKNTRLANWALILHKYARVMEIRHRPGVEHKNADGLSRLARIKDNVAGEEAEIVSETGRLSDGGIALSNESDVLGSIVISFADTESSAVLSDEVSEEMHIEKWLDMACVSNFVAGLQVGGLPVVTSSVPSPVFPEGRSSAKVDGLLSAPTVFAVGENNVDSLLSEPTVFAVGEKNAGEVGHENPAIIPNNRQELSPVGKGGNENENPAGVVNQQEKSTPGSGDNDLLPAENKIPLTNNISQQRKKEEKREMAITPNDRQEIASEEKKEPGQKIIGGEFSGGEEAGHTAEKEEELWTVDLSDVFREMLIKELKADAHLKLIFGVMKELFDTTGRRERNGFVYGRQGVLGLRRKDGLVLCIPESLHYLFLRMAHDKCAHGGISRTYGRLRNMVYMRNLAAKVEKYVQQCPVCLASKPRLHSPYGNLTPIMSKNQPFDTLAMDFVVGLPRTAKGHNSVLTITDKFTKVIRLIPGRDTWTAEEWGTSFFHTVYKDWGLPRVFVSDRDAKFTSSFWTKLFHLAGVELAMTTAYHPSADGQAERTNQTVEVALRCLITGGRLEEEWDILLPEVEFAINTTVNTSTKKTPFELLYGVNPMQLRLDVAMPEPCDEPTVLEFAERRWRIREDTGDAIQYANARMSIYYDAARTPKEFSIGEWVYLRVAKGISNGYRLQDLGSKLSPLVVGPFEIIDKLANGLAYTLKLPPEYRIHPTISIAHLEDCPADQFGRRKLNALTVEERRSWEIEKIIARKREKGFLLYKVRWVGRGAQDDSWELGDDLRQVVPSKLEEWEKAQFVGRRSERKRVKTARHEG